MKLLTFLGAGKNFETTYLWQDKEYTSKFAPTASAHLFGPDSIVVFLTNGAREKNYDVFRAEIPKNISVKTVPIPIGRNSEELWEIFSAITEQADSETETIFDVTHGLRSFPLLSMLAAAYLRAGLGVKLRALLYGAYDVSDKNVTPNRAPIFDLSPMLSLLDWASAANRFNRTGDARYLASLVEKQRKELALNAQGNYEALDEVGKLGNLAGALTGISQSLRLIRPHQAMGQIAGLPSRIESAQPALSRAATALPFKLLLDDIAKAYEPLAQDTPSKESNLSNTLEVERRMIHWYLDHEHWVQAVSLAREWMVSWVMFHLNIKKLTNLSERKGVEHVVSTEAHKYIEEKDKEFSSVFLANIPELENVLSLWLSLTDARNDIDHAGMREDAKKPEALIKRIQNDIDILDSFSIAR